MPATAQLPPAGTTPARGDLFPTLRGMSPSGRALSTRDYYMRQNLAVVVLANDMTGQEWLRQAGDLRAAAQAEDGDIVAVLPPDMPSWGVPAIVDQDGALATRVGLTASDLPALFVMDRYGRVFAGNRGNHAIPDLTPANIPGWLEFISCRCT
jgi:hypothetical protein